MASILGSETPLAARKPSIATVEADIGEAVAPWKPAMTLIESGLSGLTFPLRATSEMTGSKA